MQNESFLKFNKGLRNLSIFVKNLIIYKSLESTRDRVHFKSLQPILERKMHLSLKNNLFFNGEKSIVWQFLEYMIKCGEIVKLDGGYYATLHIRNVILPVSKSIIQVGQLKENRNEIQSLNLGFEVKQKVDKKLTLSDYRYDYSLKKYHSIFQHSIKEVMLYNEEYRKPTSLGFKKLLGENQVEKEVLYYITSYPPLGDMREYFIARKTNEGWKGERINSNLQKSRLSILSFSGYVPTYSIYELKIKIDDRKIFQINLSTFLPRVEEEQVYLFSFPEKIKYCKKYFVEEKYLGDFKAILKKINFTEGNVKS